METLGILGPAGTHSEAAARYFLTVCGREAALKTFGEIYEVLSRVEEGEVTSALVPVENSLEGPINVTLDVLAQSDSLRVTCELIWPVRSQLMARSDANRIRTIYSHPQPISQCRKFLRKNYPTAEVIAVASTARAAEIAGRAEAGQGVAAICTGRGGEINGLKLLADDIQDNPFNCTRFFEVGRKKETPPPPRADKVLLICQIDGSRAGSLYEVLGEFARRNINMTRIESRPARTKLGEYLFFFELETEAGEEKLTAAIAAVQNRSIWLKHLGTFPVIDAEKSAKER